MVRKFLADLMGLQRGLEDRSAVVREEVLLVEVDPPCFARLLYTIRCSTFNIIQIKTFYEKILNTGRGTNKTKRAEEEQT